MIAGAQFILHARRQSRALELLMLCTRVCVRAFYSPSVKEGSLQRELVSIMEVVTALRYLDGRFACCLNCVHCVFSPDAIHEYRGLLPISHVLSFPSLAIHCPVERRLECCIECCSRPAMCVLLCENAYRTRRMKESAVLREVQQERGRALPQASVLGHSSASTRLSC